ncbi:M23 family metallopeptidase [Candidatus Pelagibacter sp.]|nr:M23 family metallopeptidase [Candidatus Pelagibacter sp.]
MKIFELNTLKEYSIFFWLILISIIGILILSIYSNDKKDQSEKIKSSLDNIYFKKTLKEITENLDPRYETLYYKSKSGDTYQSIINNLKVDKNEKKLILDAIKNNKSLKILRINQNFTFKFDNLSNEKIIEFIIETDKKNEIQFKKSAEKNEFIIKKVKKNFTKNLVYKETIITDSLYNSAINLGITANIIIEFARLYGFQIDFQRDIWKDDSFQIIYEEFIDEDNQVVDTGEIIFANLNLQNTDLQLYKYEYEKNKVDYFDENGKSIKKTLMKTPINGARLSSSYGKRKHPILGYTKMHTGTDFAAPTGTPIMASGDGKVTKAGWCGGGGNCVKIKHNSVYQTVYAHMSKFGRGIKKGVRVKQGQIIGYVGSTGLSTGPHLHYEVIENGKKINSQKLKLPSGKVLKGDERKKFEISKIKIDVLKSNLITNLN